MQQFFFLVLNWKLNMNIFCRSQLEFGQYRPYSLFQSFTKYWTVSILAIVVRKVSYIYYHVGGGIVDTSSPEHQHKLQPLFPSTIISSKSLGSLPFRSRTFALSDSVCLSLRRDLDPRLQAALRECLVARGVNSKLATSILQHLLEKERSQYVNWLKTLEEAFAKNHWPNHLSVPNNILWLSFVRNAFILLCQCWSRRKGLCRY